MRLDSLQWKLSYGGARFWNALFDILDKEKKNPLVTRDSSITVSIDDEYQMIATQRYLKVVNKSNPDRKKGVMRQKALEDRDDSARYFAYSRLLEWYTNCLVEDYKEGGAA